MQVDVFVWGERETIKFEQTSKTVMEASGEHRGKVIKAKGRSVREATRRWLEIAKSYHH